jgi:glutathione S-transferase
MAKLLHVTLDPYCRRMRLALAEYGRMVELQEERPWAPSEELLHLNPSGLAPVLLDDDESVVCGVEALSEYLEETRGEAVSLLPGSAPERAETRRLVAWFDVKFYTEVTEPILTEKIIRRFVRSSAGAGSPDMVRVRTAREALKGHLGYISLLAEQYSYLAGDQLSLADLAAAAHLSAIDYLGDVGWDAYPEVQSWYGRIKSRPSFRSLLSDSVAGVPASPHYANLDF